MSSLKVDIKMDHMGKEMALVQQADKPSSVNLIYSLSEEIGALAESLKIFQKYKVNLLHIESRSSTRLPGYEFMVELDQQKGEVAGALVPQQNPGPGSVCKPDPQLWQRAGQRPPWIHRPGVQSKEEGVC